MLIAILTSTIMKNGTPCNSINICTLLTDQLHYETHETRLTHGH